MLNGRQMGDEITDAESKQAKADGLVVVFGYSDDNVELRGAIYDEIGFSERRPIRVNSKGIAPSWDDPRDEKNKEDAAAYFRAVNEPDADIQAVWDAGGYSWTFKATLPHATFDIMEDAEKFCRGIVFSLADIGK